MDMLVTELIKTAFEIINPLLAAGVLAVIGYAVKKFSDKTGIQIDIAQQEKLANAAMEAVFAAEEKASAALKANLSPVESSQKLTNAITHVLDKVPGVTHQEAQDIVLATLPQVGMGAANALGKLREAALNGQ